MTKEEDAPRNDVEGDKPSQRRKKKIKNVTIMRKNLSFNHFVMLATAAVAMLMASCVHDEVVLIPDPIDSSRTIGFSTNVVGDEAATRGGASRRTLSDGVIANADGDLSLPLVVTQEQGIRTSAPVADTRGAKVTKDDVFRMRVWATYDDGKGKRLFFADENHDGSQGLDFVRQEGSSVFHSDPQYMWPGSGTFDFVSVGNLPSDIASSISETNPGSGAFYATLNAEGTAPEKFTYRVPDAAERQSDIIIAKATEIQGDTNASVSLDFKHIMAAVNFKVGDVVAGTIKSISLTGVYNKGEYLLSDNEWVNRYIEDGGVFNANIGGDRVVVEDDALNGTQLNSDGATFMMIPQQPTSGAEIEIVFRDGTTGKTHTLRASIQGHVWDRNTTTNYMINIDGNYNLQIVPLDQLLDSHYIITKVEISSEYPNWTLAVYDTTGDDLNDPLSWINGEASDAPITIEEESKVNPMAKQGFWTDKVVELKNNEYVPTGDSARGGKTITGTTSVSNKVIYVFVPENVSGEDRNITLVLYQSGNISTMKTLTLTQHPVKWLDPGDGNPDNFWGCELLIEGGQVDWGFCWDGITEEYRVEQGGTYVPFGQWKPVRDALISAGFDMEFLYDPNSYIHFIEMSGGDKTEWLSKIDYSKIGNIEIAESVDKGHANTSELYQFDGISTLASIREFIDGYPNIRPVIEGNEGADISNTLDFAAMYAIKRNKFDLYFKAGVEGSDIYIPVIDVSKDLNWYLPAKDQFQILMQSDWGQQFSVGGDLYWTSTAYLVDDGDNSKSYAFINGEETVAYRKNKYLTMALRQRTYTADVVVKPEDIIVPGGGDNGPEYGEGGNTDNNQGGDIEGNN